MMKEEMNEMVLAKSRKNEETRLAAVERANTLASRWDSALTAFSMKVDRIQDALKAHGLEISVSETNFAKTGLNDNAWLDEDRLRVSLIAVPFSGKFKFLPFRGYDSGGRGKNDERLRAKAACLVAALKEASGLSSVEVNSSSLELRDDNDRKRVMISLWI